jgi:aminopeptidase-like protein
MSLLSKFIPITVHRVKSGVKCFDWTVPQNWSLNKATLADMDGNIILDSEDNILHVVNYSDSFNGKVLKSDLDKHLHFDENLPEAIPYRTSYYHRDWGLCLSKNDFDNLQDLEYYVDIDTSFSDGEMLIGQATIEGGGNKEVVLSSYYCHPNQINDGLSGVFLLAELFNRMKNLDLKYTYRFFFWPETIGAIAALSEGLIDPQVTEYAIVCTTVGHGERVCYKKTFKGDHSLDNVAEDSIKNVEIRDYKPTGSDERQLSSSGPRIPTGVLSLTPYQKYKEYHTSHDNIELISIDNIKSMVDVYKRVILEYESYNKVSLATRGGEPFLTKYGMYRLIGTPGNTTSETTRNWILHYADGSKNIKDISKLIGEDEETVQHWVHMMKRKGVLL